MSTVFRSLTFSNAISVRIDIDGIMRCFSGHHLLFGFDYRRENDKNHFYGRIRQWCIRWSRAELLSACYLCIPPQCKSKLCERSSHAWNACAPGYLFDALLQFIRETTSSDLLNLQSFSHQTDRVNEMLEDISPNHRPQFPPTPFVLYLSITLSACARFTEFVVTSTTQLPILNDVVNKSHCGNSLCRLWNWNDTSCVCLYAHIVDYLHIVHAAMPISSYNWYLHLSVAASRLNFHSDKAE